MHSRARELTNLWGRVFSKLLKSIYYNTVWVIFSVGKKQFPGIDAGIDASQVNPLKKALASSIIYKVYWDIMQITPPSSKFQRGSASRLRFYQGR